MDGVLNPEFTLEQISDMITKLNIQMSGRTVGQISDGYYTFDELYEFRKLYNAALFNEWAGNSRKFTKYDVHKSLRHHDGEPCFGGGWFIVVAMLPTGQISNHYRIEDWSLFRIPEVEKAKYEFDGHTPQDVLKRLAAL